MENIKRAHNLFKKEKSEYDKAYEYYRGNTDAISNYKMVTERSNIKINVNFLKKFIKEEVSYSVGNDITYISKSGDVNVTNDIDYYLDHWDEDHDSKLMKAMILYGIAYELYYIDGEENNLNARVLTPRNSYVVYDNEGYITHFVYVYSEYKDNKQESFFKVYDKNNINLYNQNFELISSTPHTFGMVPVGIAKLSDELIYDTLFKDIKGLQDALETNLSDISNEISDFRNAYLTFTGCELEEEKAKEMKKNGIIQIPIAEGKVAWLIKNINDTFIQNTLSTIEDKMYQITSHINHNERMQSNVSGIALRSKLVSLEEKCKLNQKALSNCIKTRLKILFKYLKAINDENYDYRDIKIKFTPNIPQDDLATAQMISQLGDRLSTETALSLLSFVENPSLEATKANSELISAIENDGDMGNE
ncbi:phage portal protein [Romboutsia sp. 1001285H_161024_C4]|uniref:phage portal protein n=1 Tax=Romboutsia sp. 1001285H_161024_C4 TaxID=2787109 RepID=UPI0018993D7D|nr:phage portal protein [Romboutsia sp. 1001285H_161024_C4]